MIIQVRSDNNNEPLVLDDSAEVVNDISLTASQGDLTKGAVLGEVTATPGVYSLCVVGAVDGSEFPKIILGEDVDDIASVVENLIGYKKGLFDENQLTFGAATTLDSRIVISAADAVDITYRDALQQMGLRAAPGLSVSAYQNA